MAEARYRAAARGGFASRCSFSARHAICMDTSAIAATSRLVVAPASMAARARDGFTGYGRLERAAGGTTAIVSRLVRAAVAISSLDRPDLPGARRRRGPGGHCGPMAYRLAARRTQARS